MKTPICAVIYWVTSVLAYSANVAKEEPVMLPPLIVSAPVDSLLFVVGFESKLPLPYSKVTRASFKKVLPGPAQDAGLKLGDEILEIDGVEVVKMTVLDMRRKITRERPAGTREEFVVRSQGDATRRVIILYGEKRPPKPPAPTTSTVRRRTEPGVARDAGTVDLGCSG